MIFIRDDDPPMQDVCVITWTNMDTIASITSTHHRIDFASNLRQLLAGDAGRVAQSDDDGGNTLSCDASV